MKQLFALVAFTLLPSVALAHPGHEAGQFTGGFMHPIGGADHLLAMIALGLLAAQTDGKALWALPVTFVGSMILGGVSGWAGIPFPGVEPMILASVIIFGVLVAMAVRLPLGLLIGATMLFSFAHGWAHGAEGPTQGLAIYAAGFALATMLLHLLGIATGKLLARDNLLRGLGGGTALAGLALAAAG